MGNKVTRQEENEEMLRQHVGEEMNDTTNHQIICCCTSSINRVSVMLSCDHNYEDL